MSDPQQRYQEIFECAPVALWDVDCTDVAAQLAAIAAGAVTDLRRHLEQRPELVRALISRIKVLSVNPYSLELYAASSQRALILSLERTFDPEAHSALVGALLCIAREAREFRAEMFVRTLSGERRQVAVQLQLSPRGGEKRGLLSMIDISHHKQMADRMREMNHELERSNQELEQFAYVASHDLQEPLRMVASYTQLLARRYHGQLDERADKYIYYIVDGTKRMQALVSDLLELSRVGTRGRTLQPVACVEVLEHVLHTMHRLLAENQAEVTHDPLPTVIFDSAQLGQLFQNLISNAVKFRRDEPPRIHITARRGEEGAWIISVADNGIGIPDDKRDEVFEVFKRLHARDEYPGTGVGLAISKRIVERHGGRIWVESVAGEGATFHFTLPALG